MRVYLDNAATTRMDDNVVEAMLPFMKEEYGNPSAIHGFGRKARAAIEQARKNVARHLNAGTGEIFFTSGGTESNNMAIKCAIRDLGIRHIISSKIEHHCILHTLDYLAIREEAEVHYVRLDDNGAVDLNHLRELLQDIGEQCLVTLMHANNEIGNLLDLNAVGNICEEYDAIFHSDTVQTVGHLPIDLQTSKVHMISGSGHKFHGPKGSGFLYINGDLQLQPYLHGGGQERNMRAGTENVPGIIGFSKAMDIAYENLHKDHVYVQGLKSYMLEQLQEHVPGVELNGVSDMNNSLYTVLNVSFPPADRTEFMLYNLDIEGIAASGGSACSSGADAGSHVLNELNIEQGRKSIRFSFSKYNTKADIDFTVSKLKELFAVTA